MKIISIINMKGGVAKTTLTANLGWALTHFHGKKILLVDTDMQANLSQYFMKPKEYVDWIRKEGKYKDKLTVMDIYSTRVTKVSTIKKGNRNKPKELKLENLAFRIHSKDDAFIDLIPSTLELVDLDTTSADNRLKRFLNQIKQKYDFILIDCPPTMYFLTRSALIASDAYLIPIKPDHLSSFGFILLESAIKQFQEDFEKELIQIGTIFTLVKGKATRLMDETKAAMRSLSDRFFFNSEMTDSTYVAEASRTNKTVFEYPKATKQATELKNITNELLKRIDAINEN